MITALCVDDKNGLTFFGKRISRDRAVIADFMSLSGGNVSAAPFSALLFESYDIVIDDNLLDNSENGCFCFIENKNIVPYSEKIEKIILYKWNRHYPSDKKFVMPDGFMLSESIDFEGYSHECITREIYVREVTADEAAEKEEI